MGLQISKNVSVKNAPKAAALATGAIRRSPKVVEAPARATIHTSQANDQVRRDTAKTLHKEDVKAVAKSDAEILYSKLLSGDISPTEVKAAQLNTLSAPQLTNVARTLKYKGYSGLLKAELAQFLANGGKKPEAKAGSTRDLRETVSAAKKAGLVSGPVSSLKVAELKKVVAAVSKGENYGAVSKPTPNAGTMDHNKNLLRGNLSKGYTPEATAKSKAMFGVSISALKSLQLKALVAALGLK